MDDLLQSRVNEKGYLRKQVRESLARGGRQEHLQSLRRELQMAAKMRQQDLADALVEPQSYHDNIGMPIM